MKKLIVVALLVALSGCGLNNNAGPSSVQDVTNTTSDPVSEFKSLTQNTGDVVFVIEYDSESTHSHYIDNCRITNMEYDVV